MKKLLLFIATVAFSTGMNAQIADSGFEGGTPSSAWTEASTNFGTPLCSAALCGIGGGPCVPHGGLFYNWFGGANAVETGSVTQSATIPMGTSAAISMWVKIASAGAGLIGDRIELSVDGNILSVITSHDSTAYADYKEVVVDVTAYADGAAHTVKIEGFQTTATGVNLLVDDVSLSVNGTTIGLFEEPNTLDMTVSPNPASTSINLNFGNVNGPTSVSIYTVAGQLMEQMNFDSVAGKSYSFNTANMDNGVYLISVTNGATTTSSKVVVAK